MRKIILYHLGAFLLGAVGIALYFFVKVSAGGAALGVVGPVIAVVYVVGFGVLCTASLIFFIVLHHFRKR